MAQLPKDKNARLVSCGEQHTGFVYEDGSMYLLGSNKYGQCDASQVQNMKVVGVTCGKDCTFAMCDDMSIVVIGQCSVNVGDL